MFGAFVSKLVVMERPWFLLSLNDLCFFDKFCILSKLWFLEISFELFALKNFSILTKVLSFSYFYIFCGTIVYVSSKQSFMFFESKLEIHFCTSKALFKMLTFFFCFVCWFSLIISKLLFNFCVIRTITDFNYLCRISIWRSTISWSCTFVLSFRICLSSLFVTNWERRFWLSLPADKPVEPVIASDSSVDSLNYWVYKWTSLSIRLSRSELKDSSRDP